MVTVRPIVAEDFALVLTLNNAAVPHVNALESQDLMSLVGNAAVAQVGLRQDRIAGVLIAFAPGADYDSVNYRWFCDQYDDFIYVDRIVVDETARGSGLGRAFYDGLVRAFRGKAPRIVCEVNAHPPNPGSMAFHERMGFAEVGRQDIPEQGKQVVMLAKPL